MIDKHRIMLILSVIFVAAAAHSCAQDNSDQALVEESVQISQTEVESAPVTATLEPIETTNTQEAQAAEVAVSDDPTLTPTIEHQITPSDPASVHSFMTDRSSALLAAERRAVGDNFEINLYERPFTSESMDYRDYLDITRAELSTRDPFVYVTIYLEGSPPVDGPVSYGVEVDDDLDGHGDWLILAKVPPESTWTTEGVRACHDSNGDVGGSKPMQVDAPDSSRDGFEDCIFENGYGSLPDAAWIRRDPDHADRVQIAFLFQLIGSAPDFLWGAWADEGIQDPALFDLHDVFSLEDAGSPASGSSQYPLKSLALIDNTCRWGYGFTPTGKHIGACYIEPTPEPSDPGCLQPPKPSADPCWAWFADTCSWVCLN